MNKPKFRAWDKVNKKMISWNRLLNGHNLRNVFMRPEMCGLILMQYTGLRNLKGIEICEGDRLHYSNCDGEVDVITKRNGCFWSGDTPLYQCAFEEAEIIGNIYEM